jgi:cyanophycin synthetase
MDQLYSAIFVAEAAWHYSACEILQQTAVPREQMVNDLSRVMASEMNPPLLTLQAAAAQRGVL